MSTRLAVTAACLAIWVAHLSAGAVTGVVLSVAAGRNVPALAVVYAESLDSAAPHTPGRFTLAQRNKSFQPHVLAVPLGSTVDFPNNDQIQHNVFSLSPLQPFDLGLYRRGESKSRTFTTPGVYRVFCNIHPQMSAMIVVAPTPYTTVAGMDGRFSLNLPAGRFRLTALSERVSPVSIEIVATQGAASAPEIRLDESSWKLVPHKNKFGTDYPTAAYPR